MSDSFATLLDTIQHRTGVHRLPLVTQSYEHDSKALDAERLINLYAENEPKEARNTVALISTPGLSNSVSDVCGAGPVLEMNNDEPEFFYILSGDHFYRYLTNTFGGSYIFDLGAVGTTGSFGSDAWNLRPSIAVGVNAVVVCVPPNAYVCSHSGSLNQIGGTFPGARSVTYLDGYFVFTAIDSTSQFFTSLLLDPSLFNALDFAFADGVPNILRRALTINQELWLVGDSAISVWYDAGASDFPFRPRNGALITPGVMSVHSCAVGHDTVGNQCLFWVSKDGCVYQSYQYKPLRISTHAIEERIRGAGAGGILSSLFYSQDGHSFYCLSLYDLGANIYRTVCYDTTTKLWAYRSGSADGTALWLARSATNYNNQVFFGDRLSGRLFTTDWSSKFEDGVAVMRRATLPPIWGGTHRAFMNRLEIEMEVGTTWSPGDVVLDWSNDGGYNFGATRTLSSGALGPHTQRVYTTRLGSFRQRVLRITTNGITRIYAVDADITFPLLGG